MITKTTHCCKLMTDFLEDTRIPLIYYDQYREYNIPLLYKNKITAVQGLVFCPWCGAKLPQRLRANWFDTLKNEYGIDDPRNEKQEQLIPAEFQTDEWWIKRGL